VRVTTAFNRLLRLPGASVIDVSFGGEGVIVTVRLRRCRRVCSRCGQTGSQLQIHDRRIKRWRHLDLGRSRCVIECELRRLRCRDCGVHLEAVPWARPDAHHTRDFEDVAPRITHAALSPAASLFAATLDSRGARLVPADGKRPGFLQAPPRGVGGVEQTPIRGAAGTLPPTGVSLCGAWLCSSSSAWALVCWRHSP
jgi:zinc-finger of transposase IS204/IS1001/IS1096/IS1165